MGSGIEDNNNNNNSDNNNKNIIVDINNIIVDVLGGYSLEVRNKMKELFGEKRARQ